MSQNILVVGGAGYIGTVVSDHFLKKGFNVKVIDNLTGGREENLSHHKNNNKLKIDIIIADNLLEQAIEAIQKSAHTGRIGDGKIFVTSVEQAVRIRTGETGDAAV